MEKSTQLTRTDFFEDVKVEVSSLYEFGEPLHDEPPGMSHDQGRGVGVRVGMGVPFMTGFIRALPVVQPPPPTHASTRFPSRHFDVVRGWLDKECIKELLIRNVVFHFLETAL